MFALIRSRSAVAIVGGSARRIISGATSGTPCRRWGITAVAPTGWDFRAFMAIRQFSSEGAISGDAKPIIPGIGKGKTSTGYVGLAVEPEWYPKMLEKFQALLDRLEASDMPETAQYRIDVTKWCNYVLKTARENPDDPEAVEDAVNMGQVEELLDMAEDEMIAMDVYLKTRMWELVEASGPAAVDFDPDPMKDPFAEDGDPDVADKIRKGVDAMKQEK